MGEIYPFARIGSSGFGEEGMGGGTEYDERVDSAPRCR